MIILTDERHNLEKINSENKYKVDEFINNVLHIHNTQFICVNAFGNFAYTNFLQRDCVKELLLRCTNLGANLGENNVVSFFNGRTIYKKCSTIILYTSTEFSFKVYNMYHNISLHKLGSSK